LTFILDDASVDRDRQHAGDRGIPEEDGFAYIADRCGCCGVVLVVSLLAEPLRAAFVLLVVDV
jgi:hypothetical protein